MYESRPFRLTGWKKSRCVEFLLVSNDDDDDDDDYGPMAAWKELSRPVERLRGGTVVVRQVASVVRSFADKTTVPYPLHESGRRIIPSMFC